MFGATVSLLLVSTNSCGRWGMSTAPDVPVVLDQFILDYWEQAQLNLTRRGVPFNNVQLWPAEKFNFFPMEPDEPCGPDAYWDDDLDYCVYGTFETPNNIYYCTATPIVIVHEAEHAILYRLRYDCWDKIDDGEAGCP